MESCKARTNFFTLPPELRNRIYELTVIHDQAVRIDNPDTDWIFQPAITRTNRHVRAEALQVYYGLNKFAAFVGDRYNLAEKIELRNHRMCNGGMSLPLHPLEKRLRHPTWLKRIGARNVSMIKHFELTLANDCDLKDDRELRERWTSKELKREARSRGYILPPSTSFKYPKGSGETASYPLLLQDMEKRLTEVLDEKHGPERTAPAPAKLSHAHIARMTRQQ